jgi:hypothetical protein
MHPTTGCCPHLACPARGQTGQGHLGIHARQEKRCIGPEGWKTFTTTQGPAVYRLRTSSETATRVVTLLAPGCPRPALVVAFGCEERTVADGWRRAGVQSQAMQDYRVEPPRALGQVQADEIRVKQPGGIVWMALAMLVRPRVWLAGEVSEPRDMTRMRRLSERVRAWALQRPRLFCPAGWCADMRAIREPCRAPVPARARGRPRWRPWRHICLAPVVKREVPRRVVEVARRLVDGTWARVETRRQCPPWPLGSPIMAGPYRNCWCCPCPRLVGARRSDVVVPHGRCRI